MSERTMTAEESRLHGKLTQAMKALAVVEAQETNERDGLWLSDVIAELDEMRADLRRIGKHPGKLCTQEA